MELEKIISIAKSRGFFWPSFEIYGGVAGFWDYGPLGCVLKRKFENFWIDFFGKKEGFVEVETPSLMPKEVFVASKHLEKFVDPITRCKRCNSVYRADHLIQEKLKLSKEETEGLSLEKLSEIIEKNKIKCKCGGELRKVEFFNMMFKTIVGTQKEFFLRPETAQGQFLCFKRVFELQGRKLPLGIIQIGKAFRNEISPRQGIIRLREFTQAEAEVFFDEEEINEFEKFEEIKDYELNLFTLKNRKEEKILKIKASEIVRKKILPKLIVYFMAKVQQFFEILGIPRESMRFKEMSNEEKPFYTRYAWDLEIFTKAFGWVECVANNYRTDWDLSGHMNMSREDLRVFKDGKKFLPHVWEISFGIDRPIYCLFEHWLTEIKDRVVLRIPPKLAPFDVAVFPLVAKNGLNAKAKEVFKLLFERGFNVKYEEKDSIGRRYYREDMGGTPYCVTVDYESMEKEDVTIRERDSSAQVRVKIKDLPEILRRLLEKELEFSGAGKTLG
ncbi:MAG: glycine--tRNA ligase [Candidatus Aenigmatarchaeota archaeon]